MSEVARPETRLIAQLRRFRRRLRAVTFARVFPVAVTIAMVVALAGVWIGGTRTNIAATALAAAVAAASLVAAVVAHLRTRRLADTAATLDSRFGLENRLATALEFAGHADAMSALIVADANVRLAARRLHDVPFEGPRHLAWLLTGLTAAVVIFAVSRTPSLAVTDRAASQSVLSATAGAASSSARRAPGATAASVNEGTPRLAADADSRDRTLQSASPSEGRESTGSSALPKGAATTTSTPSAGQDGGAARSAATENAKLPSTPAAGSNGRGASGARSGAATAAVSGPAQTTGNGAAGAAGGSAPPRGTAAGAGGVRDASPLDGRSGGAPSHNTHRADVSTAPAAWDRAESALAREHLPLDLRRYVRDYLIAVRPGGRP